MDGSVTAAAMGVTRTPGSDTTNNTDTADTDPVTREDTATDE